MTPTDKKTSDEKASVKKPRIGYVSFTDEEEGEDGFFSGEITGPNNPIGANLAWLNPTPFIEKFAYDDVRKELEAEKERSKKLVEAMNRISHIKERKESTCNNPWHADWYGGFLGYDDPIHCPECHTRGYGGKVFIEVPSYGAEIATKALSEFKASGE